MKISKAISQAIAKAKETDSYWIESTKHDFAFALEKSRIASGMTYADLARKLGTSPAYVSKIFRGDVNLTIESMVRLARAAGGSLNIHVAAKPVKATAWAGVVSIANHRAANTPIPTPTARTTVIDHLNSDRNTEERLAA